MRDQDRDMVLSKSKHLCTKILTFFIGLMNCVCPKIFFYYVFFWIIFFQFSSQFSRIQFHPLVRTPPIMIPPALRGQRQTQASCDDDGGRGRTIPPTEASMT